MKVGQNVTYVAPDGAEQLATVTELVDHGPSKFWIFGLKVGEAELKAVPHENDKAEGAGFWRLLGAAPVEPTPASEPAAAAEPTEAATESTDSPRRPRRTP